MYLFVSQIVKLRVNIGGFYKARLITSLEFPPLELTTKQVAICFYLNSS